MQVCVRVCVVCAVSGQHGDSGNVVGREGGHPDSHETYVQVERLQKPLCGGSRPHFFRGVCTVRGILAHTRQVYYTLPFVIVCAVSVRMGGACVQHGKHAHARPCVQPMDLYLSSISYIYEYSY